MKKKIVVTLAIVGACFVAIVVVAHMVNLGGILRQLHGG
jgi:hypothetical protein